MAKKQKQSIDIIDYIPIKIIEAHCLVCKWKVQPFEETLENIAPKACPKCGEKIFIHTIFTDKLKENPS